MPRRYCQLPTLLLHGRRPCLCSQSCLQQSFLHSWLLTSQRMGAALLLIATQQLQRLVTSKSWWHRVGHMRFKRHPQRAGLQAARRQRHRVGSGSRPQLQRAEPHLQRAAPQGTRRQRHMAGNSSHHQPSTAKRGLWMAGLWMARHQVHKGHQCKVPCLRSRRQQAACLSLRVQLRPGPACLWAVGLLAKRQQSLGQSSSSRLRSLWPLQMRPMAAPLLARQQPQICPRQPRSLLQRLHMREPLSQRRLGQQRR